MGSGAGVGTGQAGLLVLWDIDEVSCRGFGLLVVYHSVPLRVVRSNWGPNTQLVPFCDHSRSLAVYRKESTQPTEKITYYYHWWPTVLSPEKGCKYPIYHAAPINISR